MTRIPQWDLSGVVPPVRPGAPGAARDRSPYTVEPLDIVARFATDAQRCHILEGWLRYRAALYAAGIAGGFQWIDGSFLENVEQAERRSPRDVDVVTFFSLPDGMTQATLDARHPDLFEPGATKQAYRVDAYGVELGLPLDDEITASVAYWYSMWSHRREDGLWKGFVQTPLGQAADESAWSNLALIRRRAEW